MPGTIWKTLPDDLRAELLEILEIRFKENASRHVGIDWSDVRTKLEDGNLFPLFEMERTGGEPDVVGHDDDTGEYVFFDCSKESPKGRRSLCYDREALNSRKEHKPADCVTDMADSMGVEPLSEGQYQSLQALGVFDTKTSSWLRTPSDVRKLWGAIFGDRRYGRVFVYHNGADSYYAARWFRASYRI